jgi:hypothetical protein
MLQQSAVHLPVPQPRGAALHLTRHAQRRAQQRAIRRGVMGWLLDYGVRCPAGGGVEVVHLTKAARAELLPRSAILPIAGPPGPWPQLTP